MPQRPVGLADRLIREFTEQIGLEAVDAHRAAFTALACRRGWTKARVGRYLGISRARVGQKVEKLEDYAARAKGVPTLRRVMDDVAKAEQQKPSEVHPLQRAIEYEVRDWDDIDFARRLIDMVS